MLIYTFDNTVVFLSPFGVTQSYIYTELDMNVIDSIIIIQTFSGVMAITL